MSLPPPAALITQPDELVAPDATVNDGVELKHRGAQEHGGLLRVLEFEPSGVFYRLGSRELAKDAAEGSQFSSKTLVAVYCAGGFATKFSVFTTAAAGEGADAGAGAAIG
jgi:hypothetical protein